MLLNVNITVRADRGCSFNLNPMKMTNFPHHLYSCLDARYRKENNYTNQVNFKPCEKQTHMLAFYIEAFDNCATISIEELLLVMDFEASTLYTISHLECSIRNHPVMVSWHRLK